LGLGLALVLVCGAAGCGAFGDGGIWVYVDNTGKDPMVVTVDGKEEATIEPGQFQKLVLDPGARRFLVRCGDKVLFDGTQDLQPSDTFGVGRRYFFNPHNRSRYLVYTVKYGKNPFKEFFKRSKEGKSELQVIYEELAKEVKLMPAETWFEVPRGAYVLTKAPEVVVTRRSSEERTVMTRISQKEYAFFKAALAKTDPSEEDLEDLIDALEQVSE
jgi:hypothetical protein